MPDMMIHQIMTISALLAASPLLITTNAVKISLKRLSLKGVMTKMAGLFLPAAIRHGRTVMNRTEKESSLPALKNVWSISMIYPQNMLYHLARIVIKKLVFPNTPISKSIPGSLMKCPGEPNVINKSETYDLLLKEPILHSKMTLRS